MLKLIIIMAHVQPNYFANDASILQESELTDNPENVIFVCDGIKCK